MAHHRSPSRLLRPLLVRPRLMLAGAGGLALYLLLPGLASLSGPTRFLVSWNAAVLTYLAMAGWMMLRSTHEAMRQRALHQDEGQRTVLV
ncbi:MAG: DUF1345 domain-containing protein, partial [Rhodoferax sp.]|nr:DUF1345 domain-containing protein [Rhodoferax sp.]